MRRSLLLLHNPWSGARILSHLLKKEISVCDVPEQRRFRVVRLMREPA